MTPGFCAALGETWLNGTEACRPFSTIHGGYWLSKSVACWASCRYSKPGFSRAAASAVAGADLDTTVGSGGQVLGPRYLSRVALKSTT